MELKDKIIQLIDLHKEIHRIQNTIFNEEFVEGGFVWFEKLWGHLSNVIHTFEKDNSLNDSTIEYIIELFDSGFTYDTSRLTPEHKEKYSVQYDEATGYLISAEFRKECAYTQVIIDSKEKAIEFALSGL